jgi:hypothetical protein
MDLAIFSRAPGLSLYGFAAAGVQEGAPTAAYLQREKRLKEQ